ncbi:MAG: hypothetical protein LUD02_12320 [Tannerellaceae bacterium]|nr:hypothetical protein [Tannerellaceae bacterium]
MISHYRSDENIYQQIGVLSATYNLLKNIPFKTELAFIRSKFDGVIDDSYTTFRANFDLNYLWKSFMFNVYVSVKEKQLTNSYVFEENFTSYGGSVRWSNTNWHIEIGTNNPFSHHNYLRKISRVFLILMIIGYIINLFNKRPMQIIYRFSFGKKYNIENKNINTQIESAILKVD